jgi:hypothetical protein
MNAGQQHLRGGSAAGALCVVLILLLCYAWFLPKTGGRDWVASSRAALVFAIADQGVLHIDAHHETTGDKAYFNGHYYTIASIGPSLIALPPYAMFRAAACSPPLAGRLCPSPAWAHSAGYARWAMVWITFFAISLPSAALGLLVYVLLGQVLGHWRHAFGLALLFGLATVAFPYSRAFFQHQLAAFCLASGFFMLWHVAQRRANPNWLWASGLMFGLAVISEYPLVLPLAVLIVWAAAVMPRPLGLYRLALGSLPPLLAMAAYNLAITGTLLPVIYRYHVIHGDLHRQGFMGLAWPSLEALYGITFSPLRGVFFMSPFLLLMLPGFYGLWRARPVLRPLVLTLAGLVASFFLYNSAYLFWTGGASIGPRYLVPMLPLAMLPVAAGMQQAWRSRSGRLIVAGLSVASLLNVWAQTIAGQYYPALSVDGVAQPNPLLQHAVPHLAASDIATNWGHFLGLSGWWSLLPLAAAVGCLLGLRLWLQRAERPAARRPAVAIGGQ